MLLSVRDDLMGLAIKLLSEVGHSEELVFMPYLFALANSASNENLPRVSGRQMLDSSAFENRCFAGGFFYRKLSTKNPGPLRPGFDFSQVRRVFQRPPNLKTTSIAPSPTKNAPPSRAASFAVCAIGKRAEPRINAPNNLKGI